MIPPPSLSDHIDSEDEESYAETGDPEDLLNSELDDSY
jgi:hypothetical protein